MPPQRPASVTVLAIFQLIFGSLGLLCGLGGLATQGAGFNPGGGGKEQEAFQKELEDALAREIPNQKPIHIAETGSGLVLSALMLASGIGMLNLRPWGRLLGLVYAVLGMISTLAITIGRFVSAVLENVLRAGSLSPAGMAWSVMTIATRTCG